MNNKPFIWIFPSSQPQYHLEVEPVEVFSTHPREHGNPIASAAACLHQLKEQKKYPGILYWTVKKVNWMMARSVWLKLSVLPLPTQVFSRLSEGPNKILY